MRVVRTTVMLLLMVAATVVLFTNPRLNSRVLLVPRVVHTPAGPNPETLQALGAHVTVVEDAHGRILQVLEEQGEPVSPAVGGVAEKALELVRDLTPVVEEERYSEHTPLKRSCEDTWDPARPTPFIFVKTHKTGGSTVQQLLLRAALNRDFRPIEAKFLGWPWEFPGMQQHSSPCMRYDAILSHTVYTPNGMRAMVPCGKFFTILREPVSQFQSAWYYFDPPGRLPPTSAGMIQFLKNASAYPMNDREVARFQESMCYDMGVRPDGSGLFENVNDLIEDMHRRSFFVMILEHFDLSLAVVRRRLNLSYFDVLYTHIRKTYHPEEERYARDSSVGELILKYVPCGDALYTHWNRTLWESIELEGPSIYQEAEYIAAESKRLWETCNHIRSGSLRAEDAVVANTTLSGAYCKRLTLDTVDLRKDVRKGNLHLSACDWCRNHSEEFPEECAPVPMHPGQRPPRAGQETISGHRTMG